MTQGNDLTVERTLNINAALIFIVAEILRKERGRENRDMQEAMDLVFAAAKSLGAQRMS